jgi:hypothetical protein
VLVAGYVSFLYYKPSSVKLNVLQIQEKNKEANKQESKQENKEETKIETKSSGYTDGINTNNVPEELEAKGQGANSETINVDDYLKIIKTLSSIIHNIYQDKDFGGELSVLKNFSVLSKFEKDFEYLENYRVKFLLNANKNELIFPNENLSFLSELIKIEKLDSNKVEKEEYLKKSVLILRKIEDEILSKDFIKSLSELVK